MYSCNKITSTWIQIYRQNWDGFFSNASHQIMILTPIVSKGKTIEMSKNEYEYGVVWSIKFWQTMIPSLSSIILAVYEMPEIIADEVFCNVFFFFFETFRWLM